MNYHNKYQGAYNYIKNAIQNPDQDHYFITSAMGIISQLVYRELVRGPLDMWPLVCPVCGNLNLHEKHNFCYQCGQRLKVETK